MSSKAKREPDPVQLADEARGETMKAILPDDFKTKTFPEPEQGVKEALLKSSKMPLTRTKAGARTLDKAATKDMATKQKNHYYQVYEREMDAYLDTENELRDHMHLEMFLYGSIYKPFLFECVFRHKKLRQSLAKQAHRHGWLIRLSEHDYYAALVKKHGVPLKTCIALEKAGQTEQALLQLNGVDKDTHFEEWARVHSTSRRGFDKDKARAMIKNMIVESLLRDPIVDSDVVVATRETMSAALDVVREARDAC